MSNKRTKTSQSAQTVPIRESQISEASQINNTEEAKSSCTVYDDVFRTLQLRFRRWMTLENATLNGYEMDVRMPRSAVLYLRSTTSMPDKMRVNLYAEGVDSPRLSYDIPLIKLKSYTLDEIFEKNLLVLIPFYLFTFEPFSEKMKEEVMDRIKADCERIVAYLDEKQAQSVLSSLDAERIREMTISVIKQLACRNPNVQNGVKEIMGGQVMLLETDKAYAAGIVEGEASGRAAGLAEDKAMTIVSLMKDGILTREEALVRCGLPESKFDALVQNLINSESSKI